MAIAVASSSNVNAGSGTTIIITKPLGLAVGDLMIAVIQMLRPASHPVVTPSLGFVLIRQDNDSFLDTLEIDTYYKVATSSDVAASSFTFTLNTGASITTGGILRITGANYLSDIAFPNAQNGARDINNTPVFTMGVTPAANSLLIFPVVYSPGASPSSVAGYAIVTSNPSWTEAWDINQVGSLAYAIRPQSTGTGNASCIITNGGNQTTVAQLIAIQPDVSSSISDTVTTTETSVVGYKVFISEVVSLVENLIDSPKRIWTNFTKNISNWINQNKDL